MLNTNPNKIDGLMTSIRVFLLLTVPVTCSMAEDRNQTQFEYVAQMSEAVDGHQLQYLVQPPIGDRPQDGWPMLLFLHGKGECGTNIELVKVHGPPKRRESFALLAGSYVIAPQCPQDSWWRATALKALLDEFIAGHPDVDQNRVYLTGLSMGGYGSWSLLSHTPQSFAAAVPICGGGNPLRLRDRLPADTKGIHNEFEPDRLRRVNSLPIWAFHGELDPVVPIEETHRLLEILKEAGHTNVKFTSQSDAAHVESWQQAYQDPELWKWLYEQKKNVRNQQ